MTNDNKRPKKITARDYLNAGYYQLVASGECVVWADIMGARLPVARVSSAPAGNSDKWTVWIGAKDEAGTKKTKYPAHPTSELYVDWITPEEKADAERVAQNAAVNFGIGTGYLTPACPQCGTLAYLWTTRPITSAGQIGKELHFACPACEYKFTRQITNVDLDGILETASPDGIKNPPSIEAELEKRAARGEFKNASLQDMFDAAWAAGMRPGARVRVLPIPVTDSPTVYPAPIEATQADIERALYQLVKSCAGGIAYPLLSSAIMAVLMLGGMPQRKLPEHVNALLKLDTLLDALYRGEDLNV